MLWITSWIFIVFVACNGGNTSSESMSSDSLDGHDVQILEKLDPAISGVDYSNSVDLTDMTLF